MNQGSYGKTQWVRFQPAFYISFSLHLKRNIVITPATTWRVCPFFRFYCWFCTPGYHYFTTSLSKTADAAMAQWQYWSHSESWVLIDLWDWCPFSGLEFLTGHGCWQFTHSERQALVCLFQAKQDKQTNIKVLGRISNSSFSLDRRCCSNRKNLTNKAEIWVLSTPSGIKTVWKAE